MEKRMQQDCISCILLLKLMYSFKVAWYIFLQNGFTAGSFAQSPHPQQRLVSTHQILLQFIQSAKWGQLFNIFKRFWIEMQAFIWGKNLLVTVDDTHVHVLPKHRAPSHCLMPDVSKVKALRSPKLIYSSKGIMNVSGKFSRQSIQYMSTYFTQNCICQAPDGGGGKILVLSKLLRWCRDNECQYKVS